MHSLLYLNDETTDLIIVICAEPFSNKLLNNCCAPWLRFYVMFRVRFGGKFVLRKFISPYLVVFELLKQLIDHFVGHKNGGSPDSVSAYLRSGLPHSFTERATRREAECVPSRI